MLITYATKTTKSGHKVSIFGNWRGEHFAGGKKYWIEYGENSNGRRAIHKSDSLTYISKKFKEIR